MLITRLRSFRPLTWVAVVALFCLTTVARPAYAQGAGAQLSITGTGTVRVDGAVAATGATVFPGSRVTTASGVTAVVTNGGSRVTLNPETDAILTFAGGFMRADIICGSAVAAPAPGGTFEMITHGDTNVFVQGGTAQVQAEGKTVDMIANQTQGFNEGVRITAAGGSVFEASSLLCSCLCAAPVAFPVPVAAGGFPLLALLALLGGAAAVTVPIAIDDDDELVVVSPARP